MPPSALITGASSGVGIAFAHELARRQYDLVITARRVELLKQVQQDIEQEYGVRVTPIRNDLATADGAQQLFHELRRRSLPIEVLVNNAGFGRFGSFLDQSLTDARDMIQVNITALTSLTKLFAADMCERGGGYILNHASFSAIQPTPQYAVYSGTKSFVLAFSQALHRDLKKSKVRVSALCSGFFDSDFLDAAGQEPSRLVRLITIKRQRVARAGISGVLRGKAVIVPGGFYKVTNVLMRFVPRTTATALADFFVRVED